MSKIEVNTVEPQCGTTLTLGACGDTVALGSGAAQTGFGRTGTVDWITTPKVTGDSPITGVTGKGYFLNTTAGQITVNLPAGAAGSIVSMADYAAKWQTNNVTVAPNGAEKIGGVAQDAILNTEGQSVTFVYVDGTQGWVNTMDSTSNVRGKVPFITATGGNQPAPCGTTDGDYKVHKFTGPGCFTVTNLGTPGGSTTVDYMVVAGGGGGGSGCASGGAGGAGGMRYSYPNPATGGFVVTESTYPITVGAGGTGGAIGPPGNPGVVGADSIFSSITSAGGGYGGKGQTGNNPGGAGGSGGGGGRGDPSPQAPGGAGNTPSSPCTQGYAGGAGVGQAGGGGGGKTAVGAALGPNAGGDGGAGQTLCISGTPTAYAGGGGGGSYPWSAPTQSCGGLGGGGKGSPGASPTFPEMNGTVNTGGGGGGGSEDPAFGTPNNDSPGGTGGSGIVVIRYKFQ